MHFTNLKPKVQGIVLLASAVLNLPLHLIVLRPRRRPFRYFVVIYVDMVCHKPRNERTSPISQFYSTAKHSSQTSTEYYPGFLFLRRRSLFLFFYMRPCYRKNVKIGEKLRKRRDGHRHTARVRYTKCLRPLIHIPIYKDVWEKFHWFPLPGNEIIVR